MSTTRAVRRRSGYTLLELLVVLLVVGVLATLSTVALSHVGDRAQRSAAQANLSQVATAALAYHTQSGALELTRAGFLDALAESSTPVTDGLSGSASWTLYGHDYAPAGVGEFALGLDHGAGTPAQDVAGTRAVIVTSAGDASYARVVTYGAAVSGTTGSEAGQVPTGTTPADVLSNPELITTTTATPSVPGGEVGDGDGAGAGVLRATASVQVYGVDPRYEWVEVYVQNAPAGTPADQTGVALVCTVDPDYPAGVTGVEPAYTEYYTAEQVWMALWESSNQIPAIDREYTCVLDALDSAGASLESVEFVVTTNQAVQITPTGTSPLLLPTRALGNQLAFQVPDVPEGAQSVAMWCTSTAFEGEPGAVLPFTWDGTGDTWIGWSSVVNEGHQGVVKADGETFTTWSDGAVGSGGSVWVSIPNANNQDTDFGAPVNNTYTCNFAALDREIHSPADLAAATHLASGTVTGLSTYDAF